MNTILFTPNRRRFILGSLAAVAGYRTAPAKKRVAALYYLDGHTQDFLFAAKLQGRAEPLATCFGESGGRPLKHFDGLVDCIEEMFVTGKPVYPVERTLLTSGALDFLMESLHQGRRIKTPELKTPYRAPARAYFQRT